MDRLTDQIMTLVFEHGHREESPVCTKLVLDALRLAVERDSEDELDEVGSAISELHLLAQGFSTRLLSGMLEIAAMPAFLRSEHSWVALHALELWWDKITPTQREAVFQYAVSHFDAFSHWMGRFYLSELLGTRFPNTRTLAFCKSRRHSLRHESRRFLPHILEHLVVDAEDPQLAAEARTELHSFAQDPSGEVRFAEDPSPEVRQELEESLARIRNRQGPAE